MKLTKLVNPYTIICFAFFIAYSVLGIIRHNYYGSFGADLGFIDRQFWIYSNYSLEGLLSGSHFELTSLLLSPLYWLWSDPRMLVIFQSFIITFSGLAVFSGKEKKTHHTPLLCTPTFIFDVFRCTKRVMV